MEYEHETRVASFLSGLVLGAVIGAGVALMTAPESGRRARKRLRRTAGDIKSSAAGRWDELRESTSDRFDDLAGEVKGKVDEAIRGARKRFPT